MDVTAHEIEEDDNIKEIHHATGGDFGGTKVDKEFQDLLDKIFEVDFMDGFRSSHPSDWLELMNDFEVKKRAERAMEGELTRIRLPANLINLLRHEKGDRFDSIIRQRYKPTDVKISKDYLCLGSEIVKNLFKPPIASIINHLKKLLRKKELKGVKLMFLVGGFSESPLLQARMREEFKRNYSILTPQDAQTAVVKGAVMFGKRPKIVVERCLSETYGTDIFPDFVPGLHDEKKLEYVDGRPKCKDVFSAFALKNEKVKTGEFKKTCRYHPVYPNQTEIGFHFFTTKKTDVRYTTDVGVRKLPAYMEVKSPDTSKGTNRSIELRLYFDTEMKVIGVDLETGNEAYTFIDFLSHPMALDPWSL